MKLGEIIRDYRLKNDLSMGDFAKLSGISKPYVSMLEADKNSRDGKKIKPSVETLQKVSKAINLPLNDLLRMLDGEQIIKLKTVTEEEEAKLIADYHGLNSEGKNILWGLLKSLSNTYPASNSVAL